MTFVGEHRRFVTHFDQTHFNQCLQITWADGCYFGPPGFDIAQRPAEVYRLRNSVIGISLTQNPRPLFPWKDVNRGAQLPLADLKRKSRWLQSKSRPKRGFSIQTW